MYFHETRWDVCQGAQGSEGCNWEAVLYHLQKIMVTGEGSK